MSVPHLVLGCGREKTPSFPRDLNLCLSVSEKMSQPSLPPATPPVSHRYHCPTGTSVPLSRHSVQTPVSHRHQCRTGTCHPATPQYPTGTSVSIPVTQQTQCLDPIVSQAPDTQQTQCSDPLSSNLKIRTKEPWVSLPWETAREKRLTNESPPVVRLQGTREPKG